MFGLFRFIKGCFKWVGGFFGRKADALASDPNVMAATYDASIKKKENSYGDLQDAVSKLLRMKIEKDTLIKNWGKDIEHLEKVKQGSGNKAKEVAAKLKAEGKTAEEITTNSEIISCQAAFNEAATKIKEKQERMNGAKEDQKKYQLAVDRYKAQLQSMQRGVQDLRNEKDEAIAETQAAKESASIDSLLSGVAQTSEDAELAAARRARQEAVAKAQVSAEMAGNSASVAENEFIKYASASETNSEFNSLLGLETKEATEVESLNSSKLSEG